MNKRLSQEKLIAQLLDGKHWRMKRSLCLIISSQGENNVADTASCNYSECSVETTWHQVILLTLEDLLIVKKEKNKYK